MSAPSSDPSKVHDEFATAPVSSPPPSDDEKDSRASVVLVGTNSELEKDNLLDLRQIVIKKCDLMASFYKPWYYKVLLLFSAFLIGYGYGLQSNLQSSYTSYALANLNAAQLVSTVGVVNSVIGAASQLGYSRISDICGRFYVLIAAIVFYVIGTIVMCQATSVAKYATGSVFYTLGYDGVILLVVLIMADNSSLKWRLLFMSAATWPYIINTWISNNIITAANPKDNWKWDVGMWAFIFPLSAIPFVCCQLHQWYLASRTQEWRDLKVKEKAFRSTLTPKSVGKLIFWEFDVLGSFLTALVLGCILVPITLAKGSNNKWKNSHILGPFVLGFVLLPILMVWEGKFAKMPLIPWRLVKDRGLWAAMACSFFVSFEAFVAVEYLYQLLVINVNESPGMASTISGLNTFVSTAFAPIFFTLVTFMTRIKPTIIVGIGLWFLEMGLLFHFRSGHVARGGIIAARIIGGLGTTMLTNPINVSAMASVEHNLMATATALCYTTYRIGSAVGSAIGGAIVAQNYEEKLVEHGLDAQTASKVYSKGIAIIDQFPWGSTKRNQIVAALSDVQWILILVALVWLAPMLMFACCLRDPKLTHDQAHKLGRGEIVAHNQTDPIFDFFAWPVRKALGRPTRPVWRPADDEYDNNKQSE